MDATLCPILKHGDIESTDLEKLGDYLSKLVGAGMTIFPNQDLETYLLEEAGLPVPEGGYPPIEKPEPAHPTPPVGQELTQGDTPPQGASPA
jgi:hypothetical protein